MNEDLKKEFEKNWILFRDIALMAGTDVDRLKPALFTILETAISKAKETGREESIADIIEGKILLPQLNQDK